MTEQRFSYVELHCHSYFSLLDGASSPEALVERAVSLGYPALALTDHDGLYGAVRFWRAARDRGIKPIIGAELNLVGTEPGAGHLTLLAENQRGYANLCRLISAGHLAGQKGQPQLAVEELAGHAEGLICLSSCRQGAVTWGMLAHQSASTHRNTSAHQAHRNASASAFQGARWLLDIFGPDHFWIEIQRHYRPADTRLVADLAALATALGVGVVATNNVHYAERPGQRLHDVLTCIRHHTTLPEALAAGLLHPNSEQFLKAPQEMSALFQDLPQALDNSLHIAERCDVSLDMTAERLPDFAVPAGHIPGSYLRHLCEAALPTRFEPVTPRARSQLDHELAVIETLDLAGYFLVVWDIVRYAREQGIRCQGRGSAANSLVAYLLGITPVDPLHHDLLFERFLSVGEPGEPGTMPDIDVDFAADRREEVIQYVYECYGQEHVAMVCNVVTYRARSALRDAAKALTFPPDVIDQAAKSLDIRAPSEAAGVLPGTVPDPESPSPSSLPWSLLADLLRQMDGLPRHLSIHVGGMIITAAPLVEVVPLEWATMPDRVVVQWNKDSVEDAGLIKIDLLSLRTLGVVEEALDHIRKQQPLAPDPWVEAGLDRLPLDDPAAFELLRRADTIGCFQVESRAQAQMLPKLQPTCFEDIVVGVALIRPGPIQGGMVHPYLRRRQGLEPVTCATPILEPVLAETLGVIIFQEQVLKVAMAIAGFTPIEADGLRRAMSRSRSEAAMEVMRQRFLIGAQANGVHEAAATEIWQQLAGFVGFGFCKSHAAAFALVAYQTLYLKAHYPAAFYCALFNHQPMGFYPPEVVAGDARRHGVPVRRPDVNRSGEACALEKGKGRGALGIRLGLRYVSGLGEVWQERIVERRGQVPFRDLADFCRRTRLPRLLVENLVRAGTMDNGFAARTRRDLLWALGGLVYQEDSLDIDVPLEPVALPTLGDAERMAWEYELLGMAPGEQVMSLYREALRERGVLSTRALENRQDGDRVQVAGWAVVRQRPPTAKGHLFITLEDEEGLANLIVRPQVYDQYQAVLRNAPLLWVEGRLQREGQALSVLVYRAAALGTPGV